MRRYGGVAHDKEFVFLAIGSELHFVFIDGELDGSVSLENGFFAGFFLANLVFGGGRADGVLLAEETGGFFLALLLCAAGHGRFGDDGGVLGLLSNGRKG